ncbi:FHA domain-containing protein [Anaeromusa acidaminophila]|uniref:FHA domain-containing protein n=1 Tax=Anaeromusa acidaminophila TaxID=81464 RepID=UPI0003756FB3|nr:FHA domain-containing protein [Anaeromusa acidaminophila]
MEESDYFQLVFYGSSVSFISAYFFQSWLLYRLSLKFNTDADWVPHLIPGYALVLLCRQLGLSPWLALGLFFPISYPFFAPYLFYRLAKTLYKRPYWLWSLSLTLLPPLFVFPALDDSLPGEEPQAAHEFDEETAEAFTTTPPLSTPPEAPAEAALSGASSPSLAQAKPPELPVSIQIQLLVPDNQKPPWLLPLEGLALGRDPQAAQILLDDLQVSKVHARLLPNLGDGAPILLEDLKSKNGTYYQRPDSQHWYKAVPHLKVLLPFKSKIRIGESVFLLLPGQNQALTADQEAALAKKANESTL